MDFDLAEQNYYRLEKLRRSGKIADDEYRSQLDALRVTDEQGRTWMVQEQSGQWFVWDGAQWAADAPPGREGIIKVPAAQAAAPAATAPLAATAAQAEPAQPAAYSPPTPSPTQPVYAPQAAPQPAPHYGQPQAPQQAQTSYPPPAPGYGQAVQYPPPPVAAYGQPQQYPPPAGAGYPPAYAQPGVGQAGPGGYVAQPPLPPNIALARKRPGCISVTMSMFLWALVWAGAAYATHTLPRITLWWMYLGVGLGALGTLILWVRLITRHGRALRKLSRGGAA